MTSRPPTLDTTAWAMLAVLSLVWGGSFILVAVALEALPPLTVVAARMTIGALGLWIVVFALSPPMPHDRRTWRDLIVMCVLNNALPFSLSVTGQLWIPAGLTGVLSATTPVFGVIAAHLLTPDERLTRGRLGGVALGLLGVVVLLGPRALAGTGSELLGCFLVLAAAASYAAAGLWGRRLRHLPPLAAATGQATCSMALLLPLALVVDRPWTLPAPPAEVWASLVALGLLCTVFAYVLFFVILRRAGGSNVMLVTLMVPVSATVLGVLVLGEAVTPEQLAGMALVGLGLVAIDGRLLRRLHWR